jgi:hypothetical protein
MFQLFSTPQWFNGWDIAFNVVSIVVALLIAGFSWRVYSFKKENKYAYFSFAFILVAISLLFQSFTNGVLYFTPVRDIVLDVLRPATGQGLQYSDLFYRGAFFVQMASMLGAWLLIFFLSQKSRARLTKFFEVSQIALFVYFILLISVVSNFTYLVFYVTSLVLLGLIVLNYYKNYLNVQRKNAWLAMLSFLLIFMAHICFIFVFISAGFYAFGSLLMLLGFLTLLSVYVKSTKGVMR